MTPIKALETHFGKLHDPRVERTREHKLIDIIAIAICAVICGAEGWTDIENFGNRKYAWLKTFLELPNGIPPLAGYLRCLTHKSFRAAL